MANASSTKQQGTTSRGFFEKNRRGSTPATEVGEQARHTSIDDQANFAELQQLTFGMTPEQVQEFLKTYKTPNSDGSKIMKGEGENWKGYYGMTGASSGAF